MIIELDQAIVCQFTVFESSFCTLIEAKLHIDMITEFLQLPVAFFRSIQLIYIELWHLLIANWFFQLVGQRNGSKKRVEWIGRERSTMLIYSNTFKSSSWLRTNFLFYTSILYCRKHFTNGDILYNPAMWDSVKSFIKVNPCCVMIPLCRGKMFDYHTVHN